MKGPLDLCEVLRATDYAIAKIEYARRAIDDDERVLRRYKQQCRVCYYLTGRQGHTSTTTVCCGLCEKEMRFCGSCVDRLCEECAAAHRLCVHCGGDIELKIRRKL